MLLIVNYAVTTTPWCEFLSFSFVGKICRLVLSTRTHSYHIRFSNSTPIRVFQCEYWITPSITLLSLAHYSSAICIIGKSIPLGCLYIKSFANLSGKPSVPADPFGRGPCEQQDGCPQCWWKHLPLEDPQCQFGNHLVKLIWQWTRVPSGPRSQCWWEKDYICTMYNVHVCTKRRQYWFLPSTAKQSQAEGLKPDVCTAVRVCHGGHGRNSDWPSSTPGNTSTFRFYSCTDLTTVILCHPYAKASISAFIVCRVFWLRSQYAPCSSLR